MDYVKLEAWRKLDSELKRIKAEEATLREELFKSIFHTEAEGTHAVELTEGWSLSASVPYTRKLDQAKMGDTLKALKKVKAPADLIKTKYELSVTAYRLLDAEAQAIVDAVMTTTPGMPSMKLVPPKGVTA